MMVKRRECENMDCPVIEYRTVIRLMGPDTKVNHACPSCGKIGVAVG